MKPGSKSCFLFSGIFKEQLRIFRFFIEKSKISRSDFSKLDQIRPKEVGWRSRGLYWLQLYFLSSFLTINKWPGAGRFIWVINLLLWLHLFLDSTIFWRLFKVYNFAHFQSSFMVVSHWWGHGIGLEHATLIYTYNFLCWCRLGVWVYNNFGIIHKILNYMVSECLFGKFCAF